MVWELTLFSFDSLCLSLNYNLFTSCHKQHLLVERTGYKTNVFKLWENPSTKTELRNHISYLQVLLLHRVAFKHCKQTSYLFPSVSVNLLVFSALNSGFKHYENDILLEDVAWFNLDRLLDYYITAGGNILSRWNCLNLPRPESALDSQRWIVCFPLEVWHAGAMYLFIVLEGGLNPGVNQLKYTVI